MLIIIMGVSGSGKTTIGIKLGEILGLPFYDADDFHPISNIDKMSKGIALDDTDREPWLQTLASKLPVWENNNGAVLACSALKEKYRAILIASEVKINWIFLQGDFSQISARLVDRKGHYMKSDLLKSQFEILEEPEYASIINISISPKLILNQILEILDKK